MSVSEKFKRAVGQRLRDLRTTRGLRQVDVANALSTPDREIHLMRVSEWERGVGTPTTEQVDKLAVLFGVNVDAIIGGITTDNVSPLPEAQDGTPVQSGVSPTAPTTSSEIPDAAA